MLCFGTNVINSFLLWPSLVVTVSRYDLSMQRREVSLLSKTVRRNDNNNILAARNITERERERENEKCNGDGAGRDLV